MGRYVMQRQRQMQQTPDAIPHKWGESYAALRDTMRPAPRPPVAEPPPPPSRAPIVGRGTRQWLHDTQNRQPMEPMQPKQYPDLQPAQEAPALNAPPSGGWEGLRQKKRPFFGNNY